MLAWEHIDLTARAMPKEPALAAMHGEYMAGSVTRYNNLGAMLLPFTPVWLATKFADKVPSMLRYMVDIIRASHQIRWPSWVIYDAKKSREAAATGQTDWSKINPNL